MTKVRVCNKCGFKVYESCLENYVYQCFECDEDLYSIETKLIDEQEYYARKAKELGCTVEQMKIIHNEYDNYVMNSIHDKLIDSPLLLNEYYQKYSVNMKLELS
ncbi:hypothetical protein [Thomasclavelia cocleata]|uniref:hypothetical protein n=1 Tax=Thomasclavelia cocleata TaxID=69824 RepID=UPI00241E3957|nr:hypothetical protein [Thomasclavelia cocleata]